MTKQYYTNTSSRPAFFQIPMVPWVLGYPPLLLLRRMKKLSCCSQRAFLIKVGNKASEKKYTWYLDSAMDRRDWVERASTWMGVTTNRLYSNSWKIDPRNRKLLSFTKFKSLEKYALYSTWMSLVTHTSKPNVIWRKCASLAILVFWNALLLW